MFARWHSAADRCPSAMSQFRSSTLRLRTALTKLSKCEPVAAAGDDAPGAWAAGDLCRRRRLRLEQDGKLLPGVAQVAKQQGAHAARDILALIRGETLRPFRYHDYGNMATVGRGSAVADIGPLKTSGLFAWLIWLFIHIFWLIGFRNRVAVLSEWAWAYLTFQRRVRLITGERLWPS